MIVQIVERLKKDGQWQYFIDFFTSQQDKLIADLRSGQVNDLNKLAVINGQLDLLDRLKTLDSWSAKQR